MPLLTWRPDLSSAKTRKSKGVERTVYTDGCFVDVWTGKEYGETVTSDQYKPPKFIRRYAKKWLSKFKLLAHNSPFDCAMFFYNFGFDLSHKLWVDTMLLVHTLNENEAKGLKETAERWQRSLGIDTEEMANKEQIELGASVLKNGGKWSKHRKFVWRGDFKAVSKYACADPMLTFGIYKVGMKKFKRNYSKKQLRWFLHDEVMPLCREVVPTMLYGGVYIDVDYFKSLKEEMLLVLDKYEDLAIKQIKKVVGDITVGKAADVVVSKKRLIVRIMELEGLSYPTKIVKGVEKKTLAKAEVKKVYQENPHWLWGHILGEDEIRYSDEQIQKIKEELCTQISGRRHRFNIKSRDHLEWLLCEKLKNDPTRLPQTKASTKEKPKPSLSESVLREFFSKKYKFIKAIVLYRKVQKLFSSYVKPALALNHDGWLHASMGQGGTTSGRFNCSGGFNLQTLPRVEDLKRCSECESKNIVVNHPIRLLADIKCKDCGFKKEEIICSSVIKAGFIAPPGYDIINADFESLEPKCFTFMSGDQGLKDIYLKNLDMYSKVYCDVEDAYDKYSPDPKDSNFLKRKNPALRQKVKPVVLGIPYGARKAQTARLMGFTKIIIDKKTKEKKEILDVERGEDWRIRYLSAYPDLEKYMEKCEYEAVTQGYVETIVGRRRHFKYAPAIHALLMDYGISKEKFLDANYKRLKESPDELGLSDEGLDLFAEHIGKSFGYVFAKGGWLYLRSLYRNELNNAKNFKIQGLAAHITNISMLDIMRAFRQNGINGYVALQIHDEVMGYVRKVQSKKAARIYQKAMEYNKYTKLVDIPMKAEPIICTNLIEAK